MTELPTKMTLPLNTTALARKIIISALRQRLKNVACSTPKLTNNTYVDFNEDCTDKYSKAMENVAKSVKKGSSYGDISLTVLMTTVAVMRMNIQQTNDSEKRRQNKRTGV